MGYDDVIPLLGDFGRYQKRIYFLLCLPAILCAFHKMANVFLNAKPNFRCQLPDEFPNASYALAVDVWNTTFPWDSKHKKFSSCYVFVDGVETPCENYIYDRSRYKSSTVTDWNMVCSQSYLRATGDSLFMVGVMLGSIVFGELSDRFGRKLIFFISLVIQVVFGVFAAVAPEFWSFTAARIVVGATTSGVFLVAYVIAMEMVGPSKRLIAGTVCQMFFSLGYMLVAPIAYFVRDWRYLQLALTLPGALFLCYWWFIPESARWLISHERIDEAKALIHVAAKENRVEVADEQLDKLLQPDASLAPHRPKNKTSSLDIFRHPNMRRRALVIFYDWFANNVTYYGLSWNTSNLGGNDYLNFLIAGAVEIPAYVFLLLTLNRWGRKVILCGTMGVAGLVLLATMAVPDTHQWLVVVLAMIGKLAITASYGTIYIFSVEQFPTVIRNAGLGAASTCAKVGSILAPIINLLNEVWPPLPLIIMGSVTFTGACLSLMLPETLNKQLPETLEDGERFGRKAKKEKRIENEDAKETDMLNGRVELNGLLAKTETDFSSSC